MFEEMEIVELIENNKEMTVKIEIEMEIVEVVVADKDMIETEIVVVDKDMIEIVVVDVVRADVVAVLCALAANFNSCMTKTTARSAWFGNVL